MGSTRIKRIINIAIVVHVLAFAVLQCLILALYGDVVWHPLSRLEIYLAAASSVGVFYHMVSHD